MFEKIETLLLRNVWAHQRFCHSAIFAVSLAVISFFIGLIPCNELKIARISFYGRTLMSKNVNNDVSKDSPFPNILLMTRQQ